MSATAAPRPAAGKPSGGGGTPGQGRRLRPLIVTLAVVVALIVAFFWASGFYADVLWYTQLGYERVLFTQWLSAAAMFLVGLLGMAIPAFIVLQIAYRTRPTYARLSQQLGDYQRALEPMRRAVFIIVPLILGALTGLTVSGSWQTVLTFFNSTPFEVTDPEFGLDVSFYVFQLPFWRGLVSYLSAVTMVALGLTVAANYLYGGIRITGREIVISKAARIAIASLAALYVLLQGVSFWFDRYNALTESNGRWSGALYTDVHARIPGLTILAGAAVIVAILFIFAAIAGRWSLPTLGVGALVVVALVVGVAYPGIIQSLLVVPNEQSLESEYIQRNIDATRAAYGVDHVEEVAYEGVTDAEPGQLREDAETTANIRIMDPALISQTFAQFEQERNYYAFPELLDVDRYDIDGKTQDAVVALREINVDGLSSDAQAWVNQAIVYTHGYGLVAAYGSQRGPDGQPLFFEAGMPQTGALDDFEPRVYFGENSPRYSIVGAPEGSDPVEFDHVRDTTADDSAAQTHTTFHGNGGPSLGNWLNRLVYSVKFQSEQILLSDAINSESQILYDRHPVQRVSAAAPYLTIDGEPYASVVDGQLVWIIDGYTTTDAYPYSTLTNIEQAAADATTPAPRIPTPPVNYIRNSVKATVNAYDGSVTLYAWDSEDPVLKTWQKVFPNTVKPMTEMSGELLSHVRYPQDMFKVQRQILATYHVTNPGEFFNQTNTWQLPLDPTTQTEQQLRQPPYYLTMQMPGQEPAFSIYSTYIPNAAKDGASRNVLTGYLSANANAGSTPGQIAEDYGKLTLLRIQNDKVNGPGQVQNIFNSNSEVANELNLLERGGRTAVLRGNLLTLPVGNGFLYVQPVYVKSTGETSYPLMRRVLVAFGDKIAFEPTLDAALDELFAGDAGASAGDENAGEVAPDDPNVILPDTGGDANQDIPQETPAPSETPKPNETPAPAGGDAQADLDKALADAEQALDDRTNAYAKNDLVAAAEADQRLVEALERADAAFERIKKGE